ncbi:MAG TPA: hypothetical protein VGQ83_24615 [Polyangia bacterium]
MVALAGACALVLGCGHAPPRLAPSVAVMPVDTLGLPPGEGAALEAAVWRAVEAGGAARPAPPARVAAGLEGAAAGPARCRESDACLAGVGRRVPADLVLALGLAGLGDLRLVRGRLVRSADGLTLQDVQETVQGGHGVDHYAAALAHRLFPPAARRPWYRSWWFWASVAVVAGGTAAITWAAVHSRAHETGVIPIGDL